MSLLDLITGSAGNEVAEQAESKFGISKGQILALLAVAAPLIITYLKNKSQDTKEAEALNKALEKDHNGSILNNLSQASERQAEGNSILNHIFGNEKTTVENQLSANTGISLDKVGPILGMLTPVIMGYIGKEKQASGANAGGLGDLLGGLLGSTQQAQGSNPLQDILGNVLGGNQEKGGIGDLISNVLGDGDQKKGGGGLGDLLGGFLGGK